MTNPDRWAAPPELAADMINSIGLGQLVTVTEDGEARASSLPFHAASRDGADQLVFHIPGHFPQHGDLLAGRTALALFTGVNGYVSPGWYSEPDAPTWDFETVEVRGTAVALTREETWEHLNALADHHERDADTPFTLGEVTDEAYVEAMLSAIGGFRIPMTDGSVSVRRKLSQNRTAAEVGAIRDGLVARRRPMDLWLSDVIGRHAEGE
jgi:transcriptional regulator